MTGAAQEREALLRRYAELVRTELPAAAERGGWSLRADHCFGRVLLDDAVGACWYTVLDRRAGAAFRQLDDGRLAHAVATGERVLAEGDALLRALDAQSLAWRGKPPKRSAAAPRGERGGRPPRGRAEVSCRRRCGRPPGRPCPGAG